MGIRDKHLFASPITLSQQEIEACIREIALQDRRIIAVYLFGSRAKGEYDEYSDVDVGVYTDVSFTWQDLFLLYEEISKRIHSDRLDVVWLNKVDPIFLMDVISTGKVIFCRDEDRLAEWELLARKMYRDSLFLLEKAKAIREGRG